MLADIFVFEGKRSTFRYVVIQRLEALLFVLQILRGPDEFLHCVHVEKLMDVVVVSQEIRWDFSRCFELAVFSNHGLDLFHESVFRVVAREVEGSVVGVLKLLGLCELDDPG